MTKNIKRISYAIAGAAVLFVGLAGNVQAVPITTKNPSGLATAPHQARTTPVVNLGSVIMTPINPRALLLSGSDTARRASGSYTVSSARLPQFSVMKHGTPVVFVTAPTGRVALGATVPDGGTTGALLGGSLSALIFLKRKLEPVSGV